MYCSDEFSIAVYQSTKLGLFSAEIPSIIYYSHITAVVVTLLVSLFVISRNQTLAAKILLAISVAFSTLSIVDILLWTQINVGLVMLLWSSWLTLFTLIFCLSFYFLYAFITKTDLRFRYKAGFALLLVLVEVFSITNFNLEFFDLSYCEAGEGVLMLNAVFGLSFLVFIATVIFGVRETRKITSKDDRNTAMLATIGVGAFLLIFSFATYMASIINIIFANGSFEFLIEQYGYFGMTVFIGFLSYIIVRYKAFKIKFIATTALVIALVLLVASQLLFVRDQASALLTVLTLFLVFGFGFLLIQSVRHEVAQREEIEKLAVKLEKANKRLKVLDQMKSEFVSIASHQLRSPLTSIRGYASMLLEGSFGQLSEKAKEAIVRIGESSRLMALSIEDYLNVSRIQSGNMKYELSDFNAADMASEITDDMRQEAIRKGLLLTFKNKLDTSKGVTHADVGKTHQILHNLLDNSMKYTPKGSIEISVRESKRPKQIHIDIADTGIGMEPETITSMFDKFERAENANDVNVTGTGLGLYIARKMAQDMGGDVTASSPGTDLGSTFTLTLPLHM